MHKAIGLAALAIALTLGTNAEAQNSSNLPSNAAMTQSYGGNQSSSSWFTGILSPSFSLTSLFSKTSVGNSPGMNYGQVPGTDNAKTYLNGFGYQRPFRR